MTKPPKPAPRLRADLLLVARGLLDTRARAQAAIAAGRVRAAGRVVAKASDLLPEDVALEAEPAFAWVSRAGLKLEAALTAFGVDPAGLVCLDVGASTGGFTDVLLARGAAHVTGVDVGRDQLHPRLRADPRVTSLEELDARDLAPAHLPAPPALVVADVSFIGLLKAMPRPLRLAAAAADLVALVKPQFEAGRERVGRGGLVDPAVAEAVAGEVAARLDGLEDFRLLGLIESPIRGGDGNREFLVHARRRAR